MADHADASYSLVLRGLLSEQEFNRAHDAIVEGILLRHHDTPVATIAFAAGMALGGWKAPKRCACLESPRSLPRGSSRTKEITMNMTQTAQTTQTDRGRL